MTKETKLNVGDLVKMKSDIELSKLGVSLNHTLHNDIGVVIQVVEASKYNYVTVSWQKCKTDIKHFVTVLDKIS